MTNEQEQCPYCRGVKRIREIKVGPRSFYTLDVDGQWQKRAGVPITIKGFKFFFVPLDSPVNVKIEAYSLDSLKLFDGFRISHQTALYQCATEEGFIRAVMPLLIKIDRNLDGLKEENWKSILRSERATAITECGARNQEERKFIDDFLKEHENG